MKRKSPPGSRHSTRIWMDLARCGWSICPRQTSSDDQSTNPRSFSCESPWATFRSTNRWCASSASRRPSCVGASDSRRSISTRMSSASEVVSGNAVSAEVFLMIQMNTGYAAGAMGCSPRRGLSNSVPTRGFGSNGPRGSTRMMITGMDQPEYTSDRPGQ